nr:uncharacterized protein LOC109172712 [Ipomoea batatas]GMD53353.1 uncharacterized protein LOC109172712 [Ipomoea batatas]
MPCIRNCLDNNVHHILITIVAAVLFEALGVASVVVPSTGCYVLDNSSYIYDFVSFGTDMVLRFCKDVQARSQGGYLDFGRYDKFNYFVAGSGQVNFIQVDIICGDCPNGQCKGGLGCICSISNESSCRTIVELAIPCDKPGKRVFEGFTVGFHPRKWEIVYNGMTQLGFEKVYKEFSFSTEQTQVDLYMTAVASLSSLVQKPVTKVKQLLTRHMKLTLPFQWKAMIPFNSPLLKCAHGLDALPGMAYLSACLETLGGVSHSYTQPEDTNRSFENQASWEQNSDSSQGTWRTTERTYGSI